MPYRVGRKSKSPHSGYALDRRYAHQKTVDMRDWGIFWTIAISLQPAKAMGRLGILARLPQSLMATDYVVCIPSVKGDLPHLQLCLPTQYGIDPLKASIKVRLVGAT